MAFTDIFIKRPVLSVVVSLLILLIGLRAAMVLPIRQYPKLSNTVINVTTVYPGASADLIQGFITTPIEQAVASAEGVDYMTSNSVLGTSTIQVYVKLNHDPNQALTEVLAKVNSVKYLIPKEAFDPVVTKATGDTIAVMYLGQLVEVAVGEADVGPVDVEAADHGVGEAVRHVGRHPLGVRVGAARDYQQGGARACLGIDERLGVGGRRGRVVGSVRVVSVREHAGCADQQGDGE